MYVPRTNQETATRFLLIPVDVLQSWSSAVGPEPDKQKQNLQ